MSDLGKRTPPVRSRPVLFNTEMVRAIAEGKKTVTRRAIKPQPKGEPYPMPMSSSWPHYFGQTGDDAVFSPPYWTGDVLYVRETWTREGGEYFYRADFDSDYLDPCETLSGGYPGDCVFHPGCEGCMRGPQRIRWHPSIHMPREAARIFLRVTDVRAERLNDITEAQAKEEGVSMPLPAQKDPEYAEYIGGYYSAFSNLWDSTIKPIDLPIYGWDANPWVWVIEFEQINLEEAGQK